MNNYSTEESSYGPLEAAQEAKKFREIMRSQNDDRRSTDGFIISGIADNPESFNSSCRLGYALSIYKRGKGLVQIGMAAEDAFDKALTDTIMMSGCTRSCVPSMITRCLGFTGAGAIKKVKNLFTDAFLSEDHRFDDLLYLLLMKLTRKDNPEIIRKIYLSV